MQLNNSHLEIIMWRPMGGPSSWINVRLYTKRTLDQQVHHHLDTRHGTAEDNSYLGNCCNENIQHKGKK